MVDYLQLWAKVAEDMRGNFTVRERVDMLGGLLRELALRLHSPVLALASQNRSAGTTATARVAPRSIRLKKVAIWSTPLMWFVPDGSPGAQRHATSTRHRADGGEKPAW